jgi:hypothetical protein
MPGTTLPDMPLKGYEPGTGGSSRSMSSVGGVGVVDMIRSLQASQQATSTLYGFVDGVG